MKKIIFYVLLTYFSFNFSKAQTIKLYGMTEYGGASNKGVIFKYDVVSDTIIKVFDFNDTISGGAPYGSLMMASNGKFYGMTKSGGAYDKGVIFEYDPSTNTFIKKYDFDGAHGAYPRGTLIQASDGKLYGMTPFGGTNNEGVIFRFDPSNGSCTRLFSFDYSNDGIGGYPDGSLLLASDGYLYGFAGGGLNGDGVMFKFDLATNTYTRFLSFGSSSGSTPEGSLIQASNGNLYGMTTFGGSYDKGVIFEYNPNTDNYNKLHDFDGTNGGKPYGDLIQASNGKLYGLTSYNGGDAGVIFEYDITTNTYTKLFDFLNGTSSESTGSRPYGTLLEASHGKLYGVTSDGGSNNYGVVFEYDINTGNFTKLSDFNLYNGAYPKSLKLLEINNCDVTYSGTDTTVCNEYVSPSGAIFDSTGTYVDTIPNSCGADSIITINLTVNTIDNTVMQTGDTLIANQTGANYQWIDCSNNSPITGATDYMFVPAVSGSYAVEITNGICTDTSDCFTVSIVGSEDNQSLENVKIYPNPANNFVIVELGNLRNATVNVLDETSKIILTKKNVSEDKCRFDFNKSVSGFYIIEIKTETQVKRFKLTVN